MSKWNYKEVRGPEIGRRLNGMHLEHRLKAEQTLGRKYGVSDNAVRKWARAYGLL